ncbi:MAG: HTH domain-containing protein [Patescibacteria group bacterium]|nr:hypothetical protein [Patescibacteria group bacterium]
MSNQRFTKEEIEELLKNPNVQNCSKRSVTYSQDFKQRAISLYDKGFTSMEIFIQAGLNPDLMGRDQPKACLGRWRRIVQEKGIEGLVESRGQHGKGGRPKTKGVSVADRIEYLETQIAYLKAENAFLAKLRAKRRE